ncbi:programmed cell death protein 2 [Neodiprion pinetum]|uniref:Programmed cell death protein 2 n=1 Tax=Neodiprion lecontei TaxID=441921 RepID=A0A6J0B7A1_NEOLC|nr:programmed cell death protein 2 [Neodiprion lecontei]XP_046489560.1 programmed cell death protein 2 [Neodiprion pinetum]
MENKIGRIDIGFIEDCEEWRLASRFFPSKVGGKPAWLNLKDIPRKEDVECQFCKQPCIFLMQIYAPYENNAKAFHRTIFIFICRNPKCCKPNNNSNLKVFRSQLEKDNKFYPSNPPIESEEWRPDITTETWTKSCYVCGLNAPSHCSKCKKVNYCSREHQVYDWTHGHKIYCGMSWDAAKSNLLLPEYEIVVETEENDDQLSGSENVVDENQEIIEYEKLIVHNEAGTLQNEDNVDADLLKMSAANEDEVFFEFTTTVKKYPDQILRYERGGNVLYISSENQVQEIPDCRECGSERQFEFQIMPQLLNYLQFEDTLESLDWGILAIFTCKNSCETANGYVTEYVWKQDIVDAENKESL